MTHEVERDKEIAGTPPAEYPRNIVTRFLPGSLPDEEGDFPEHTPWMAFGPDGSGPWVIRCGAPDLKDAHRSFDSLFEWAEHVLSDRLKALESVAINVAIEGYLRDHGLSNG